MIEHLLLITLGPVQEFIAQARRTRDLWYGSHLLSELGRAAARALIDGRTKLVFPALDPGDPELDPCLAPVRANGQPPLNIPNKLLAIVPAGVDPTKLASDVRAEVLRHWREDIAAPVKEKCHGLLAPGIDRVWDEQIDTLVEFLATWAPLNSYPEARNAVERAIAGRKNLRDFSPWRHTRGAVPKSSLDGARETVLRPRSKPVSKFRIAPGEQLDAVGLVKRAGGEPDQFVPIVNVALACWVKLAQSVATPELTDLRKACLTTNIHGVTRPDLPCASLFQFDASILLPSRWEAVFEEQGIDGDPKAWGGAHVHPLLRKMSEPYPYVACLVADGDRVGRAIDLLLEGKDPVELHRAFSRVLSKFATEARKIVEQDHNGALIYSGGDDVLAFLPLPQALACTAQLRKAFEDAISPACSSLPSQDRPTLSVGIGIGHIMDGMGDLLALGRDAEREAKRERNSLAVLVDKRSGGRLTWSALWNSDPAGTLQRNAQQLEESLSTRKVYEIASVLRRLPSKPTEDPLWAKVLVREVERALSRVGEGSLTSGQVGIDLDGNAGYEELRRRVGAWVDRVLIARVFARSVPHERKVATSQNSGVTV